MNMINKITYLIFLFFIFNLQAEELLRFKYNKGDKQKVTAEINGSYYLNRVLNLEYHHEYKTIRTINDVLDNIASYSHKHYSYITNSVEKNVVREITNTVETNYDQNDLGVLFISNKLEMPTLRNIPVFPENKIEIGHKWKAPATEVQDFFDDGFLTIIPLEINYTFEGFVSYNSITDENDEIIQYDHDIVKISYDYQFDIFNNDKNQIHTTFSRILGKAKNILYFDNVRGKRVKELYERHYTFLSQDQYTQTDLVDKGYRIWNDVELIDKKKIEDDIQEQIEKDKIEDVKIEKNDEGVKLSMENLKFVPNSTELLEGEEEKLKQIAKILKNYKNKSIMITGHTADVGTTEAQKQLSIDRAKFITETLIELDAISPKTSTYRGLGATDPVDTNETYQGRKRNRRVEITILEE